MIDASLVLDTPVQRFRSSEEERLRDFLKETDKNTVCYPVSDVKEVTLNGRACTLSGGRRLTSWALYQVCGAVCPGLFRFINELSGSERTADEPRHDFSFDEAVDVYNRVVARRFDTRVSGHRLLVNTRSGLIEGLIGQKYQRLPNCELYERTKVVLAQLPKSPSFYEAILYGRWLLLRYYNPRTFTVITGPDGERDRYLTGYHFSNNEVGEAAARAAAFLLRDSGRTVCLCPSTIGKVKHLGMKFEERLRRLLDGVLHQLHGPDYYRDRLIGLRDKSLGLTGKPEEDVKRMEDLIQQLVRRQLSLSVARSVVNGAADLGSYEEREVPDHLKPLPSRNVYDLFNALGREAKRAAINIRERIEQIAYAILTGRVSVQ
jgi:hypothetical protein